MSRSVGKRKDGTARPRTESTRVIDLHTRIDRGDPEIMSIVGEIDALKPRTRSDCRCGIRPCPFVSCRYHLYLDVNPENGSIKFNFPHLEVWELPVSCALDLAEKGGLTLEEVGDVLNLTRERIRQFENWAKARVLQVARENGLNDDEVDYEVVFNGRPRTEANPERPAPPTTPTPRSGRR